MPDTPRDLLFLLHDVARLIRIDADRRAGCHGMTRAQWILLIWLERQPGITQKELAGVIEVEPITVARLIDRLEAAELVERRPDPRDRRIWRLHLLPAAIPVLRQLDRARADMARVISGCLDDATLEIITEGLQTMKTTLSQHSRDDGRPARRTLIAVTATSPAEQEVV
jgi:MarR family transcriptional regulator for hemolysin